MTRRTRVMLFALPALLVAGYLLARRAWNVATASQLLYEEIDLKALGGFPLDDHFGKEEDIPARWRKLDGTRVALKGFMFPNRSPDPSVHQFQFVDDLQHSRWRGPPLVQERVFATAPASIPFYEQYQFLEVRGVLHVGINRNDSGTVRSVYRMDVEGVSPNASAAAPAESTALNKWNLLALAYLLLACLVGGLTWRRRRLLARRSVAGLCQACGYDLRASTGRCPECGTSISAPSGRNAAC